MSGYRRGLWLCAAFSAAIFAAVYLLPTAWWVPLGLGLLAPAGVFVWRGVRPGVLVCLGAAAALLWCGAFRAVFFAPAEALDSRRLSVTAVISEPAQPTDYGARVPCWVTQGGVPVKATLYSGAELLELDPGDKVTAVCDCAQTALEEETRFTTAATYGVFLTLRPRSDLKVEPAGSVPWWCLPTHWGRELSASIQAAVPQDVAGLLAALVTGDKTAMSPRTRTDLARTGTVHLVAVSGMHVCFLVSFLTLFTGMDPRRRFWVCAPVVVLFALAVGATASVMRACIFQLAFLTADLLGREEDRWTTITGALALLLLVDPFSAANVGLQMSFAAVMGIAVVTPRAFACLNRLRLPERGKLTRWGGLLLPRIWQLLAASLGAMVFTMPLSAYYFGSISLLAPLTNLLVLPVASALFAGTLTAGLVGMLWPGLAACLGAVLAWPGRYVALVARCFSAFPYCAVSFQGYYPVALGGVYALVFILLLWRRQRRRGWLFFLCGSAMVLSAVAATGWSFAGVGATLTVLDVGQGQSVLLASQGHTALIDCGGSGPEDPGDVCADYLNDRGVAVLDALLLTHYHTDHVSGLDALFHRLTVRRLVLPRMDHDLETQAHILDLARAEGAAVTWLDGDSALSLGRAQLTVFAPLGDGGANEEGASVQFRYGPYAALVTGDMNTAVEADLVAHAPLGRCQVLVAGHHGSNNASGQALINAIDPETVLISCGENVYGHPGDETLSRLAQLGAQIRRTDQEGTLTVRFS